MKQSQVKAAVALLEEGNTVPFIARYRKEMTGELDENQLRDIAASYEFQQNLFGRKSEVIRLLDEHGAFADEETKQRLLVAVQAAQTLTEVDDIYRPYRPKRKTRASNAKERGLEPLARWLTDPANVRATEQQMDAAAAEYVSEEKGVATGQEALQGAADIFAEEVADDAQTRKWLREYTLKQGLIRSSAINPAAESVYESYYAYEEALSKVPPHRILAMNRGEREDYLRLSVAVSQEEVMGYLVRRHVLSLFGRTPNTTGAHLELPVIQLLENAAVDAYKRLLAPAIEREIRSELTDLAEEQAIRVFGDNLQNLLLQPPIRGKAVLGVDPAYRTGCKLAAVDDTGKLLEIAVIYPTPPQSKVQEAMQVILRFLDQHQVELIAIGNGTASRETEAFIADCVREYRAQSKRTVPYVIVSEAGASVYSASKLAGEEFPDLDVSERSAISIARRVQDPLAELVKIDPKAVGVGQYQHDVSQKKLDEKLAGVVETVVNRVGVDVNTASPALLSHVAGLTKTVAKNIVEFREQNGRFKTRSLLAKVPRMGPKTLEQCVGFLRINGGDDPLDATAIHPESYPAAVALLRKYGDPRELLARTEQRQEFIEQLRSQPEEQLSQEIGVGIPTLRDILDSLERPGRDPREDVPSPILRTDVLKLEDLQIGMVLKGTVRNVVDFGAFVDIGIKNDGLVHISELSNRFVKRPMDVVAVGDVVNVRVIQIDAAKGRVGLSMKDA